MISITGLSFAGLLSLSSSGTSFVIKGNDIVVRSRESSHSKVKESNVKKFARSPRRRSLNVLL